MEAASTRKIHDGTAYSHLFPEANTSIHTIVRNAEVNDTVKFIPDVVAKTLGHTKRIAAKLKGFNDYDTCRNIWHFVYNHIAYKKDRDGYEQVRSPARTWHDRRSGVDCDCYTTFISSILTNLKIPHLLRITKYNRGYFQHIYPVARLPGKTEVVIDCVTDKFNYEVPFSEKKDFNMDLQYLDGIGIDADLGGSENLDYVPDTLEGEDGLGRAHKKHEKHKKANKKSTHETFQDFMEHGDRVPEYGVKKKKGLKKLFNAVNKLNPATLTLRNGILASMKLNIGQAAKRLRWSYLTPNEAAKKGIDMQAWKKLVETRQKLDNIFFGAGGKPENLKKAVLKGKGNKDKAVHGLGDFHHHPHHFEEQHSMSVHTPLRQLLGPEIYHSENEGTQSMGELGEPATMATVAAASGVIASIVAMIKKVGDIFKGNGQHSKDFDSKETTDAEKAIPTPDSPGGAGKSGDSGSGDDDGGTGGNILEQKGSRSDGSGNGNNSSSSDTDDGRIPPKSTRSLIKSGSTELSTDKDDTQSGSSKANDDNQPEGFWEKNKKWLLPTTIGVGGIALIAAGIHAFRGHGKTAAHKPVHGLSGHGHQHKKKNHHRKAKRAKNKVKAVVIG